MRRVNDEIKSGLFIIFSLLLLVFSVFWLRYFAITPEKQIIIRFKDPGPVSSGMLVYYQGINIGKVPRVGFSDDFKHTHVYVNIYKKELELPANVDATIRSEGLTGQKYINLSWPEQPVDALLANGDIIAGRKPFGLNDIRKFFEKNIKNGKFKKMFEEIESTITGASLVTAKMDALSGQIGNIISNSSDAVDEFTRTCSNINGFVEKTELGTARVFDQIEKTKLVPNMNKAFTEAADTFDKADTTVHDAGKAARRLDNVGQNINEVLNQRFLIFKLMFGRASDVSGDK